MVCRHDLDAERAIIGGLLLGGQAPELEATDFVEFRHQQIFEATKSLIAREQIPDEVLIQSELKLRGVEIAGGWEYMQDLITTTPSTANMRHYAEIVKNHSNLRGMDKWVEDVAAATSQATEYTAIAEEVQTAAMGLAKPSADSVSMAVAMNDYFKQLATRGDKPQGLSWGSKALDRVMKPMKPGRLYTVCGRPAMGKTNVVLHIARSVLEKGGRVLLVSIEMGREEILDRLTAAVSGVTGDSFETGNFSSNASEKVTKACAKMAEWKLHISDKDIVSLPKITAEITAQQSQEKLDLVVVDYLQLIQSIGDNREQQIANVMRGMKVHARRTGVPIILVSQLNRNLENREDKRPQMSDLRESGTIEQDSDAILSVYRHGYYHPGDEDARNIVEITPIKQRQGGNTTAKLRWEPEFSRLVEL